jgi:hypothetical protein
MLAQCRYDPVILMDADGSGKELLPALRERCHPFGAGVRMNLVRKSQSWMQHW